MQAVILAGGQGARLKPFTAEIPKPLLSVGDKPIIELLLKRMQQCGVKQVHLAVNHLAHLIKAVLGDGRRFDLEILYSAEERPLSTAAPIKLINGLHDNFLVANGDVITDLDFRQLYDFHIKNDSLMTIATHIRRDRIDYGVLIADSKGVVTSFSEKPLHELTVSMGVYVFSKKILDFIPTNEPFGFDQLMLSLLEKKKEVHTFQHDGYWLNVNRPDDFDQAQKDIEILKRLFW